MKKIYGLLAILFAFALSGCDVSDSKESTPSVDTVAVDSIDSIVSDTINLYDYISVSKTDTVFVLDSVIDSSNVYWSSTYRVDSTTVASIQTDTYDSVVITNGSSKSYLIYKDNKLFRDEVYAMCVPQYVSADSVICGYGSNRLDFSLNADSAYIPFDSVAVIGDTTTQTVKVTAQPTYFKVDITYKTTYTRTSVDGYSDCIDVSTDFNPDLTVTFPDSHSFIPYRDPTSHSVYCKNTGLVKFNMIGAVWVRR